MQHLQDLLSGRLPRGFGDAEWKALLDIAEEENVLPWVVAQLRELGDACTPQQKAQLDEIWRESQAAAFVWAESLKSTLMAFDRAELQVISLKGPSLAERIYGDAALRTCFDLDLLVRQNDLERAESLLAGIGYVPHGEADDYHRRWLRKATILELHHNVENPQAFAIDLDGLWARSRISQFQGVPIRHFGPTDELHYLCLHAVRHRFERLCIILDLALAFRQLAASSGSETGWSDPVFDNIIALSWMMATHLDSKTPMPQATGVTPRNRQRLQSLADRLWEQRMLDSAESLDWAAQHRFYLAVENPGWRRVMRRCKHVRILLTRTIDVDYAFAEGFGLRRNWQVRLMRPLRLFLKTFRRQPKAL